jgi:sugar-specific transcriptional regulator TrmB
VKKSAFMKKWLKNFNDAMAAAAFAEAGEFETAKETLREKRKILLALTGKKADIKAFQYALNMCIRIGAELVVLYPSEYRKDLLIQFKSALKKEEIFFSFTQKSGCIKEEILTVTKKEKDILFVVVDSTDIIDINCRKYPKAIKKSWQELRCPLVVVSDMVTA